MFREHEGQLKTSIPFKSARPGLLRDNRKVEFRSNVVTPYAWYSPPHLHSNVYTQSICGNLCDATADDDSEFTDISFN